LNKLNSQVNQPPQEASQQPAPYYQETSFFNNSIFNLIFSIFCWFGRFGRFAETNENTNGRTINIYALLIIASLIILIIISYFLLLFSA
jgi:hypothetical protein